MGWELAAIIQTPSLVQSSFTKYTLKMLMIYQRKIDANFEKVKALRAASSLPHRKGFDKAHYLGGKVFGASGNTQENYDRGQGHSYSNSVPGTMYRTEPPRVQANGGGRIANGYATMVQEPRTREHPPSYWASMNGGPVLS